MRIKKFLSLFFISWFGISFTLKAQPGEPISDLKVFCSQQKGFNLLGKFDVSWSNTGYTQKEFSTIKDLGFNFVRLPLDYRTYTQTGNWDNFIEAQVVKIDQALQWGEQYNVHVCINLHRAPGYCVNPTTLPANQQLNLWTDSVAQKAFVKHWEFFAKRYKNISPQRLSFNLVNEPSNVTEAVYVSVMKKAIDAIHNITPNRVIFVDGLDYGRKILLSLKGLSNIAQAMHSYDPFQLTHYKADWVNGSSDWPVPKWPMLNISNYLYGPIKSEFKSTLTIQGNFPAGTEVVVNVGQVSSESTLRIMAGNKTILSKKFVCGPELGTDFTKIVQNQWGYQNISNKNFLATVAEQTSKITFDNVSGDWMTINSISIKKGDIVKTYSLSDFTWGKKQGTYQIDENGNLKTINGEDLLPFGDYKDFFDDANENNIPVMVQEFGVHNQTPHLVAVAFLTDLSAFFREQNVGWALWNLTGSFGILNSTRADCTYETYQGYKLDRKMLDALTKSGTTSTSVIKKPNHFKLFPIPVKDVLFFSSDDFNGMTKFEIRDIAGRLQNVFNIEIIGSEITKLNIARMKPGIYLLSATNNDKRVTGKFLIE
jgi:aryl-phospho-beta-D-glucosidase BglC (GH1 family)